MRYFSSLSSVISVTLVLSLVEGRIMVPQICKSSEPVNMLPYRAKETLQVWLNWGFWDEEIILDFLGWANSMIRDLTSEWGRQETWKSRGQSDMMAGCGPQAKDWQQPLEAGKDKETHASFKLLKGPQPYWRLNFSLVRSILDFWLPEL